VALSSPGFDVETAKKSCSPSVSIVATKRGAMLVYCGHYCKWGGGDKAKLYWLDYLNLR